MEQVKESALSIGKHLRAALLGRGIGERLNGGIYPVVGPEKDMPYIAYKVTGMETTATAGPAADKVHVELAIYAADYDSVCELAEAVRIALIDLRTPLIRGARVINQSDDATADGDIFVKFLLVRLLTSPI